MAAHQLPVYGSGDTQRAAHAVTHRGGEECSRAGVEGAIAADIVRLVQLDVSSEAFVS